MARFQDQILFFKELQDTIGQHIRIAKWAAELLSISEKTVYKKIRGEVSLTLEEAIILKKAAFQSSPEKPTQAVQSIFRPGPKNAPDLTEYWDGLGRMLKKWSEGPNPTAGLETGRIPLILFIPWPELAAFQHYRTLLAQQSEIGSKLSEFLCMAPASSWYPLAYESYKIWENQLKNSSLVLEPSKCMEQMTGLLNDIDLYLNKYPKLRALLKKQLQELLEKTYSWSLLQDNAEPPTRIYINYASPVRQVAYLKNDHIGQVVHPFPGLSTLVTFDQETVENFIAEFNSLLEKSSALWKNAAENRAFFNLLESSILK